MRLLGDLCSYALDSLHFWVDAVDALFGLCKLLSNLDLPAVASQIHILQLAPQCVHFLHHPLLLLLTMQLPFTVIGFSHQRGHSQLSKL